MFGFNRPMFSHFSLSGRASRSSLVVRLICQAAKIWTVQDAPKYPPKSHLLLWAMLCSVWHDQRSGGWAATVSGLLALFVAEKSSKFTEARVRFDCLLGSRWLLCPRLTDCDVFCQKVQFQRDSTDFESLNIAALQKEKEMAKQLKKEERRNKRSSSWTAGQRVYRSLAGLDTLVLYAAIRRTFQLNKRKMRKFIWRQLIFICNYHTMTPLVAALSLFPSRPSTLTESLTFSAYERGELCLKQCTTSA